MAASVGEPKELCESNDKLEAAAETGSQGDSAGSEDHVKETKKGLFGRSAEFLKSPEASAVENAVTNGKNGNVVEETPKKSAPDENEENKVPEISSSKEVEEEARDKVKSLAEEIAVCEAKNIENVESEGTSFSHEKRTTDDKEVISKEVADENNSKEVNVEATEESNEQEEKEKHEENAGSTVKNSDKKDEDDEKKIEVGKESDIFMSDAEASIPEKSETNKSEAKEPTESSVKTRKRARSKAVQQEELMNERRRSLRTPKPTPVNTPTKPATEKLTRKMVMKVEKAANETPTKSDSKKKDAKAVEATPTKRAAATSKQGSSRKSKSDAEKKDKNAGKEQTSDANDPFNISNIDNHPVILGNIQIHSAQFGSLKFTKASPGASHGRYEKTEQTAGERRSNLPDMTPRTTPKKSLSELSGAVGSNRRETGAKSKRRSNTKVAKELTAEEEPMETDESATPKNAKKAHEKTKSQMSNRTETQSRKRPSSIAGTPVSVKQQKLEPILPKLTPDEQYAADHRENEHVPYMLGARVYALWNREYYSAIITADFDAAGRYGVTFVQDNLFRKLVITGIIPLQAIVQGVKVYATDPDVPESEARLEEVQVVSAPESDRQKWYEGMFRVKICESGKEFNIKWDKLCFSVEEAKTLQTAKFNSVTDVIADNIDSKEGRKTRASRHSFAPETVLSPSVSKQTPRKRNSANRDKRADAPATVEIGLAERQTKNINAGTSEIFAGVSFVVTSAMRRLKEEDQGGFSKREIRQMIEGCGGTVVEDFTKIPSGVQMFLIADTHYRTHKYLSALARSVPCVSHRWIRECVEKGEMIDYKSHMLPAGVSLLTNKLTSWHQSNNTLLSGKRIFVYTRNTVSDASSPNFIEIWSPLVAEMGATVLNEIPEEGIDILLTDATCPDDLVQKARRCNALVVSSEWIIQAIIEGSLPDPNAHERFRYDFIERPEGA